MINIVNTNKRNIFWIIFILVIMSMFLLCFFISIIKSTSYVKLYMLTGEKEYSYSRTINNTTPTTKKARHYKKMLHDYGLLHESSRQKFLIRCYKLSRKNKSFNNKLENGLPDLAQVHIMTRSIRCGFKSALGICVLFLATVIYYAYHSKSHKLKLGHLTSIAKALSVQMISGISVYSIILNIFNNAIKEPKFMINTSIFMISIMCLAFVIYTSSVVLDDSQIIRPILYILHTLRKDKQNIIKGRCKN